MDKQATLETIMELLDRWSDDRELPSACLASAKDIYEQMPITLAEMSHGPTAACTFDELVRLAGHDVFRAEMTA